MNKQKRGTLRIGTSGIVVPGTKLSFPPAFQDKSRLYFYSSLFNTLEVNSSFYKIPMTKTFEKWSNEVDESFQFTIKLWREITHTKKLEIDLDNIDKFLKAADLLGNKKGCLLVQFPGKITLEYYNQVEQILERIVASNYQWRIAVEFRNASWYVGEVYEMLDEYGASLALHDIPKGKNLEVNKGAKFVYVRFHGPRGDYRGGYDNIILKEWSKRMEGWLDDNKDVYAYFNNTMGLAFENAMTLKSLARKR
ncbi:MAG: DUF72 domain-containing protein [Ferruginibacter sp.]